MPTDAFPRLNLPAANLIVRQAQGLDRPAVMCLCRGRFVSLTPEEWVRQHFLAYMVGHLGYPLGLVAAEAPVMVGSLRQRADIVAFSRQMRPLVIVECKAPSVTLSQQTLNQACRYQSVLGARAVVLTNGMAHYCVMLPKGGEPVFSQRMPAWADVCGR